MVFYFLALTPIVFSVDKGLCNQQQGSNFSQSKSKRTRFRYTLVACKRGFLPKHFPRLLNSSPRNLLHHGKITPKYSNNKFCFAS